MKPLTLFILAMLCLNYCFGQKNASLFIHLGKSLTDKDFYQALEGINKPTTFSIDKSINSFLSFGTYLAHKKLLAPNTSMTDNIIGSDTSLGLRGHLNLAKRRRVSIYLGGMVGFQLLKIKKDIPLTDLAIPNQEKYWQSKGIATLQVGCRYFPKTWFGYFIEVGLGNEPAALGICIKL